MGFSYSQFENTIIVRNYKEFKEAIFATNLEDVVISFDHDLQDFEENGAERTWYTCLKLIIMCCLDGVDIPPCYFHTQNIIGKKNMAKYYLNALKFQKEGK